jgi:dTDP-glucose 4,6-dehydratase
MANYIVTGGLGFIGSNLIKRLLSLGHRVVNLDCQTYAANKTINDLNLENINVDISTKNIFMDYGSIHGIFHLAAESHVDNSIKDSDMFVKTNVLGTKNVLDLARKIGCRLVHVSTDEVYGSILSGSFSEDANFNPSSPYSATKCAAECMVNSYIKTYGADCVIARPSNNYGPNQNGEKFIPKCISLAKIGGVIPVYGSGFQYREWLHVEDCTNGLILLMDRGVSGEAYNLGSGFSITNMAVVNFILGITGKGSVGHVSDRLGHDFRYSINSSKIKALGWTPRLDFYQEIFDLCEEG